LARPNGFRVGRNLVIDARPEQGFVLINSLPAWLVGPLWEKKGFADAAHADRPRSVRLQADRFVDG